LSDRDFLAMALPSRRDTIELGRAIAAALEPGDLALLSGELGAGKTFLARAIARGVGVPPTVPIPSPTFTLVQEYEARGRTLIHADLYRLRDGDGEQVAADVRRLGLAERRSEGAVLLVEWGDALEVELGGPPDLVVQLSVSGGGRSAQIGGRRAHACRLPP
jgi:tRNA threonylcarbamoyladenosine biosynthesis protein TsaE